jgi:hypothetical protein
MECTASPKKEAEPDIRYPKTLRIAIKPLPMIAYVTDRVPETAIIVTITTRTGN